MNPGPESPSSYSAGLTHHSCFDVLVWCGTNSSTLERKRSRAHQIGEIKSTETESWEASALQLIEGSGFRFQSSGFRVSGFKVQGSGFRIQDLGAFRFSDLGVEVTTPGHQWEFHFTAPSTCKIDSTRKTRQKCWELELFALSLFCFCGANHFEPRNVALEILIQDLGVEVRDED